MRLAYLFLAAFVFLAACSDPRNTPIPSDPDKWETQLAPAIKKLTDEERGLVAAYMMRSKFGEAFGGKAMPAGITIRDAIAAQREFVREEQRREAEAKELRERVERERAEAQRQIDAALTVAFVGKSYSPADYSSGSYQDELNVSFAFENKSIKSIAGFKGKARFEDMFGDEISENNISYDETIPPGKAVRWRGSINYNQFMSEHVKLRTTPTDKIKFRFIPQVVLFTDGTKLEMPEVD
jgi:hypothetical protein